MPSPSIPDALARLIERARDADGQPPFSDGSLVQLRTGEKQLLETDDAAAVYSGAEAEFVVDPAARGAGVGTRMLELLVARCDPEVKIWAHGDHPAARALAASHGFVPVRRLLQLRATVGARSSAVPTSVFRPGLDEHEWLALNARAFSFHPEQGSVTRSDLDQLTGEPWFDPADFLLLREGGDLVGYCWLKIEDGIGEFYVVGVDPERQGEGLGRRLMDAGLARLAARGIRTAALYVESDNVPAVALYRSLGFTEHSVDIQYARV
ncbi:mycothiol synthase [Lacisediminihabitans sp. FW035]